jgi:hypothetical protein
VANDAGMANISAMRRRLPLTAALLVGLLQPQAVAPVTLELRVFNGAEEVTRHVRATIHRAGDRGEPTAQRVPAETPLELSLPEGIYDAQVFHEQDGKVLNIRWANRLIVMRYPDEGGRHLEVVNFQNGYGALQVRSGTGQPVHATLHPAGRRDRVAADPRTGPGYTLFVLLAGSYDLEVTVGGKRAWHAGIEVPLDRTRFFLVPES